MRCAACGYVSLERRRRCPRCGASPGRAGGAGAVFLEVREEELATLSPPAEPAGREVAEDFRVEDDLGALADTPPVSGGGGAVRERDGWTSPRWGEGGPIVDRDEQVPERFWAPQAAGLVRRAAALAADLTLLAAVLGLFYAGAYTALAMRGFDLRLIGSPRGREAALVPFALLALLLGLGYFVTFHAAGGATPGKRLLGLQVLRRDGSFPSPAVAFARWLCALAGASCAGLGLLWALVEPRRRGWADLCSGTVVAERRSDRPGVDITGAGGYHATAEDGPR